MKTIKYILLILLTIVLTVGCDATDGQMPEVQTDAVGYGHRQWVGTSGGLFVSDSDGVLRSVALPSLTHHPYPGIHAQTIDSVRQRLWIGAWNHLYCYDLRRERFVTISDSTIYRTVALATDTLGRVLAQTERGLFRLTLADTLPEGRAEQIDNRYYAKQTPNQMHEWKWETEEKESAHGTIAIVLSLVIVIAFLAIRLTKRRRRKLTDQTTNLQTDQTTSPTTDQTTSSLTDQPVRPSFLERAEAVVQAHLTDEDFTPEQFAREMAVSRAQLFRKLKAACGMTVMDFVNDQRVARAAMLLTTTDRLIDDIATACGFSDTTTFRRCFAKRYGTTPSQYRTAERNEAK